MLSSRRTLKYRAKVKNPVKIRIRRRL